MTPLHRRSTLTLLAAGTASLAGCSETADETDDGSDDGEQDPTTDGETIEGGDLPPYASLLRESDRSSYFYGSITFDATFQHGSLDDGERPTDPLLVNPMAFAQLSSFGVAQLGTSPAVDAFDTYGETTDASAFVYADGVYAITGSYERDDLTDALVEEGYDPETTADAYAVSVHGESGEAVGVTDGVFAYSYPSEDDAFDAATAVERTVATAVGERESKHETDDDFDRLLRTGGADEISLGLYTREGAFDAAALGADRTDAETGRSSSSSRPSRAPPAFTSSCRSTTTTVRPHAPS